MRSILSGFRCGKAIFMAEPFFGVSFRLLIARHLLCKPSDGNNDNVCDRFLGSNQKAKNRPKFSDIIASSLPPI